MDTDNDAENGCKFSMNVHLVSTYRCDVVIYPKDVEEKCISIGYYCNYTEQCSINIR